MHEFKGIYKENSCSVKIGIYNNENYIKEPYILLNLEMLFDNHSIKKISHCDFLFVYKKGNKYSAYIVELKDISTKGEISKIVDKFIIDMSNKLNGTLELLNKKEVKNFLKIDFEDKSKVDLYGVLVISGCDKVKALLSHRGFKNNNKFKNDKRFKNIYYIYSEDILLGNFYGY